ncbi:LPS export ABC transporter permease LptF [Parahaliea aestuarii]|uniref:Lipopolysaccharide export system permease protein LptF n=1 Tax=Parahaliea aestuarii TaxID=1852021 RepID=A0A5C8ZY84_9GAMM|nr:LPS export ABC transporter permease LptF [Parahaliea aestuarii]TXS93438.1 LPS export ABC transporter permease LptF [Parahaliea aestuarii]
MKILRYLTRDVLTHMLAVSFVLLVVIFSGRFVKYLAEAAVGDLAADILLPVMFYRLPGFLELIVPLGLFIGILMSYGRLYVESEMVVLSACGVSPVKLAGYTMVPALVVALLVGLLSLLVTPLGAARSAELLQDPSSSQGLQTLAAGRFQTRRGSDMVSYARDIDPETGAMQSVFLSQGGGRDSDPRMVLTVAQEGEVRMDPDSGARYLELRKGYRYEGVPGDLDYRVTRFERFGELIPEPEGGIRTAAPVDGRPTTELLASQAPQDIAALHWRLSLPVMVPIVALIALCMSRTDHRRGRYIKMAPAFLIYLGYLMLLANARSAVEEGKMAMLGGFWGVHLLFLLLGLALLFGPDWLARLRYWRLRRARA